MGSKHSICAAGLLLALVAGPARSADFAVDSQSDAGDAAPGDGRCAAPDGACTLRAAVQEANALPGADRLALPAGTFTLSLPGPFEDAALTGDLDLLDDVTLTGAGANLTVVDAGGLDRVLHVPIPEVIIDVSGLTLRGGFAEAGAGILNAGVLDLERVVVRDCASAGIAGGINNLGQMIATNSAVLANTSLSNGGGIANDGPTATMLLVDSEVSGNRAEADAGGFGGPGLHILLRTRVADNFAAVLGGGTAFPPGGTLVMMESTVERNDGLQGGGIAAGGPTDIESSTIADNVARDAGGGIGATSQRLHVANSTISGNRAATDGGGIAQRVIDFRLRNVTITGNVSETGNGGGLANRVPLGSVSNTIIAGNIDLGGEAPDCSGTLTSQGHNLIGDPTGCSLVGETTGNLIGVDAQLGPLADNGGPTFTHLPQPGSPAIDAGAPPEFLAGPCTRTDQRGVERPQDGDGDGQAICDIGAVEVGALLAARRAAGGGWLETLDARTITFGVLAYQATSGPSGHLSLRDHAAGVEIRIGEVEEMGPVQEPCGSIRAGANALQLTGTGDINGAPGAQFRVCVEGAIDDSPERLWLECLSGCTYDTGSRVPDDALDGGSLEVRE